MSDPQKKAVHGCLFWGGIVAGVLLLCALLAGYAVYRAVRGVVDQYTDTRPTDLPAANFSKADGQRVRDRINAFEKALDENKETEPLALTSDDINALFASDSSTNSKGRFVVTVGENDIKAQLSVPAEELGMKILRGRYFNGSGTFLVSLRDGYLRINVESLAVKGRPLPESFMKDMRRQNFGRNWADGEYDRRAARKLDEIKVSGGKLIFIPKKPEPVTAETPETNAVVEGKK